jgi:hypothetical protein
MVSSVTALGVSDPPVPNRTTRIAPASAAVVARDNVNAAVFAAFFAVLAAVAFYFQHSILGYILGGLALLFVIGIFSKKSDVGQCPYCMAMFRQTIAVKDNVLRCEECGEYSQVTNPDRAPDGCEPIFTETSVRGGSVQEQQLPQRLCRMRRRGSADR